MWPLNYFVEYSSAGINNFCSELCVNSSAGINNFCSDLMLNL